MSHSGDCANRLLLVGALAIALITLLGAAGESIGRDRMLKANTVKTRTHSLFRQGCEYYELIPMMKPERLAPLVERFALLLREQRVFLAHAVGVFLDENPMTFKHQLTGAQTSRGSRTHGYDDAHVDRRGPCWQKGRSSGVRLSDFTRGRSSSRPSSMRYMSCSSSCSRTTISNIIARDVRILRDRTLKEHAALHPIARMIMNVALDSTMRSAKVSLGGGHGGPKGGGGAVPLGRIAGADVAGCIAGAGLVLRIAFSVEFGVLGGLIGGISASIATWW